jgi:hypothetical protein
MQAPARAGSREVRRLVLYPIGLERWAAGPEAEGALRARLGALADFVRRDLPYRRHVAGWLTGVRDLSFPLAEYAGEVSYVDAALGALRAELDRLGLAERTVLVVTADHGESLGEHGIWFDHFGLSDTVLHVPLFVWAPGRVVPARRPEAVRSLDIAPTVLRLAGLPVPPAMRGRDLFAPGEPAPVVADGARGTQAMLRVGRWKLVRTLESFFYVDAFAREVGPDELFDLETDPGEGEDAAAREPTRLRALAAEARRVARGGAGRRGGRGAGRARARGAQTAAPRARLRRMRPAIRSPSQTAAPAAASHGPGPARPRASLTRRAAAARTASAGTAPPRARGRSSTWRAGGRRARRAWAAA